MKHPFHPPQSGWRSHCRTPKTRSIRVLCRKPSLKPKWGKKGGACCKVQIKEMGSCPLVPSFLVSIQVRGRVLISWVWAWELSFLPKSCLAPDPAWTGNAFGDEACLCQSEGYTRVCGGHFFALGLESLEKKPLKTELNVKMLAVGLLSSVIRTLHYGWLGIL